MCLANRSERKGKSEIRGGCGRATRGILPLHPGSEQRLVVDWTRCEGHGLCGRVVPELIRLDEHGYPRLLDVPVPFWLSRDAGQAVDMCPALALRLTTAEQPPAVPVRQIAARPARPALPAAGPPLTGRIRQDADLAAAASWLAELGGRGPHSDT